MKRNGFLGKSVAAVVLGGVVFVAGCQQAKPQGVGSNPPLPEQAPAPPPSKAQALNESLRAAALRAMLEATDSSNAILRANAVEALQESAPDQARDAVIKGLTDQDEGVRFAACMAAGQMKLAEAHDRLLKMHDEDKSAVVQIAVRFALHKLGDVRYSHDLEQYIQDTNPEIRGKTALVLGLLGEPSGADLLRPLRRDPEPSVRLQAASSLWRLKDPEGLDDLISWAIGNYPDDAILATLALAAPKDPIVIQHVRANLVTDYPEVDLAAARGMGILGSDEGYTVAMNDIGNKDQRRRFLAALALGAIGRPDAQTALGGLLNDPSPSVRLGAATAILELREAGEGE